MARTKTLNFGKLNAELFAADAAIDPLLAIAKITEIAVDGKSVPASDAPLPDKIAALAKANPVGEDAQPTAFALEANDLLSKENDTLKAESVKTASVVASLSKENAQLRQDIATAQASVQQLQATNAELTNRLSAAINQFTENGQKLQEFDAELTKRCVAHNCLSFEQNSTPEQKAEVAAKVSTTDKLKAYDGAVHAALARTGVSIAQIPVGGMTLNQASIVKQLESINDPRERAQFFKKNAEAISEARKALKPN